MRAQQIEWGEPKPWGYKGTATPGTVGGLLVAQIVAFHSGGWGVVMFLSPLPDHLDRLTDTHKASERQARATAQRVVNGFTRILTGSTE